MIFSRLTLTKKVFLYTIVVSIVVWVVSDKIQTDSLTEIFNKKLSDRFSLTAEKQRILFDRYVKGHHQTIKLFSKTHSIIKYVSESGWENRTVIENYSTPPPWLPVLSTIRNFIQPRYLFLLTTEGKVKELYQARDESPPDLLFNLSPMLLNLSLDQGYLTQIDNQPYLIATIDIFNTNHIKTAKLMLASPLDEEFLIASQGGELEGSNIIVLMAEGEEKVLVSSNASVLPAGTDINTLKDRYLIAGQGFFDYGATDIIIELVSLISNSEVNQLTNDVVFEDRALRIMAAVAFMTAFLVVMAIVTRRLRLFTNRIISFSKSLNFEVDSESRTGDELKILENLFLRLSSAVEKETAALEHQALHDTLTELPNRKLLHNRLQQEILRASRRSVPLVLIMSDLNHFKEINDTLGHHIGDLVLIQAARKLYKIFRQTDSVARLGGDEFGILLPETNLDQAVKLARLVIQEFGRPIIVEGHTLSVGISMGLAESPLHGDDVNILVQRADVAMYLAKREKLGFSIYDPDKDTHSIGRLALMTDFRSAIKHKSLELYYQPKIRMSDNEIIGVEALLRWNHPDRGLIMPDDFIPLAEQTGLITLLTDFVIKSALKQCLEWKQISPELTVAVNISAHSLHEVKFIKFIKDLIDEYEISASCLTLEITESDIMTDPIRALETLENLSEMGVILSVDDFGTGYSSLSYLKQLPVQELKIDQSFVKEMYQDVDDAIIVQATIDMAHNLGLKVVAEGVENIETRQFLESMQCDSAQGYFYSKPLTSDEFTSLLTDKGTCCFSIAKK